MNHYEIIYLNKRSRKQCVRYFAMSEQEARDRFNSNAKFKNCIILGILRK